MSNPLESLIKKLKKLQAQVRKFTKSPKEWTTKTANSLFESGESTLNNVTDYTNYCEGEDKTSTHLKELIKDSVEAFEKLKNSTSETFENSIENFSKAIDPLLRFFEEKLKEVKKSANKAVENIKESFKQSKISNTETHVNKGNIKPRIP